MDSSVYKMISVVMDNSFTNVTSPIRGTNVYQCPNCQKTYNWKTNLTRHLKVECGKVPKLFCQFCDYKTKHKSTLVTHLYSKHKYIESK